jgi:propionate CoA-transferase
VKKIISAEEAVKKVKDGDCICIGGFVGMGHPEALTTAIEKRFLATGKPKDLTITYAAGQGDGKEKGINHLAHQGLIKRMIAGHWGLAPKMGKLVIESKIEAYNFPQGVISHLYREIAAKRPGLITHVGLKTYVDPRVSGAKLNSATTEDMVKLIEIDGEEKLFYKSFPIDVAFIRGTSSDSYGNISMEREAGSLEMLAMAQAVRNSGGIVIAQVERIVKDGNQNPWIVRVPSIFVDYVVKAQKSEHWQTFAEEYNPAFSGEKRIPSGDIAPLPLDERKIISRRAFREITGTVVVNLGIGMPEGVSIIANEEGKSEALKITVEAGAIGGVPAGGLSFGASYNPEAIIDQPYQFDFYDGGGLDIAFLGMAQADRKGNVNVSKFGGRLIGCGGFINISQNAKKVVFCGTFTSGGLKIGIEDGKVNIINEGKYKKFIEEVEHITFSGEYAADISQDILFVTERAVFKLTDSGMELIETAPGIDLKKDILEQMEFKPLMDRDIKEMDPVIFKKGKMGNKNE